MPVCGKFSGHHREVACSHDALASGEHVHQHAYPGCAGEGMAPSKGCPENLPHTCAEDSLESANQSTPATSPAVEKCAETAEGGKQQRSRLRDGRGLDPIDVRGDDHSSPSGTEEGRSLQSSVEQRSRKRIHPRHFPLALLEDKRRAENDCGAGIEDDLKTLLFWFSYGTGGGILLMSFFVGGWLE